MNDIKIAKISLIMTAVGICGLLALVYFSQPARMAIENIDQSISGQQVQITGKLTSVSTSKDGTTFITIEDRTGSLKGVLFKSSDINFSQFNRTDNVIVEGKIAVYRGDVEIIVDKMEKH